MKLCTALTLTYCSDGGRSKTLGGYIDKVKAGFFCFEKFLSILSDLQLQISLISNDDYIGITDPATKNSFQ